MPPQSNRGKQRVLRLAPLPGAPALGKRRMSSSASSTAGSQPLHGGSLAASQIFSGFKLSAEYSKVPPPRRRVDSSGCRPSEPRRAAALPPTESPATLLPQEVMRWACTAAGAAEVPNKVSRNKRGQPPPHAPRAHQRKSNCPYPELLTLGLACNTPRRRP